MRLKWWRRKGARRLAATRDPRRPRRRAASSTQVCRGRHTPEPFGDRRARPGSIRRPPIGALIPASSHGPGRRERGKKTRTPVDRIRYISRDIPQCWPMSRMDRCPDPGRGCTSTTRTQTGIVLATASTIHRRFPDKTVWCFEAQVFRYCSRLAGRRGRSVSCDRGSYPLIGPLRYRLAQKAVRQVSLPNLFWRSPPSACMQ